MKNLKMITTLWIIISNVSSAASTDATDRPNTAFTQIRTGTNEDHVDHYSESISEAYSFGEGAGVGAEGSTTSFAELSPTLSSLDLNSPLSKLNDDSSDIIFAFTGPRSAATYGESSTESRNLFLKTKFSKLVDQISKGEEIKPLMKKFLKNLSDGELIQYNKILRATLMKQTRAAEQGVLILDKRYKDVYAGVQLSEETINAAIPLSLNQGSINMAITSHMKTQTYFTENGELTADQFNYLRGQYIAIDNIQEYNAPTHQYMVATKVEMLAHMDTIETFFGMHPDVTLVLLEEEDLINVGHLPYTLKKLAIIGDGTTIGNNFLQGCDLISVDLTGLKNVSIIGDNFLGGCTKLSFLDLSSFHNLKTIGNQFLHSCWNLTYLNLYAFQNVTTIGNDFLCRCINLSLIDLSAFHNLKTIGNHFLYECENLSILDLSGFYVVETIGDFFLFGCIKLRFLYLSAFHNLKTIGSKAPILINSNPSVQIYINDVPDTVYNLIRGRLPDRLIPNLHRDEAVLSDGSSGTLVGASAGLGAGAGAGASTGTTA